MEKQLSAIVVVARDNSIGKNGGLLCHLPADLKHFKTLTMSHSIIMGRHTFESFPKGALPGRQNIVITRQNDYQALGATVAHSPEEALEAVAMPGEVFVIGGEQIYRAMMPLVRVLHLTRIHADFPDADAHFPLVNPQQWRVVSKEAHKADERNPYDYDFVTLARL
ncbi:MAG: dihydrofolate reductase [Muribaculaceae bacterium]|nr:dihydrofolate reductase [Muribaculaceae bacterium]